MTIYNAYLPNFLRDGTLAYLIASSRKFFAPENLAKLKKENKRISVVIHWPKKSS